MENRKFTKLTPGIFMVKKANVSPEEFKNILWIGFDYETFTDVPDDCNLCFSVSNDNVVYLSDKMFFVWWL